jgi:HlyD family secretion protein
MIKALHVEANTIVKAGDILAEIDTALLEAQVAIQEANIERQRSDIANQELQLADQRRQAERARQLYERGLQTEQQYESVALALRVRESQLSSARKMLIQAEANLTAAQLNVGYATIRAPIDGVIVQRRIDVGQTVQASMNTPSLFMMCTPLELLKLTAFVDESDVGRVRPGMTVQFRVGTHGDEYFKGSVDAVRLNAVRTNEVVTYPVWINVPNDDLKLRPGMTADVQILVAQTQQVRRIPNEALRFRPSRAMYASLGLPLPDADPIRAIDHQGDRVVDPDARRTMEVDENAATIDELVAPLPRADARATVWAWDEAGRRLTAISVRVGVTDGDVTELLEGEIRVGDELVTSIILPPPPNQRQQTNNPLLGNPRGRGR